MKTHGKKKRGNAFFLEVSIETISIIKRVKLLSLTQTLDILTIKRSVKNFGNEFFSMTLLC